MPKRKSQARQHLHVIEEHMLEAFLQTRQRKPLLRFITCGSVDDGKSTLIGRLLLETRQVFDDQFAALQKDSLRFGTHGSEADLALLVDGLLAEREQGITIDVAYRYFSTDKRKFIVADTPGHEQYTRNMITGASTADVAVILVDASKGLSTQTRRHAFLVSLMGIKSVVLVVNKMDAINYNKSRFHDITEAFLSEFHQLNFKQFISIPISALKGDNITARSQETPWYSGPTLLGYLEAVETEDDVFDNPVFPIQWICRPNPKFRGISGTLAQGTLRVGDKVQSALSKQLAHIKRIVTWDGDIPFAEAGKAITLVLDKEIEASRGDVLALPSHLPQTTDQFIATIIWMGNDEGLIGRSYNLKLLTQQTMASITKIKYRTNVNSFSHESATSLKMNDICECSIATSAPIVFDSFEKSKSMGAFILTDRYSHATVAAGLIKHSLRRSQNIHPQKLSITKNDRERLNGHKAKVIWLTGLSGAGKSYIANALEKALYDKGFRTYILDGDNIRHGLNKGLGFTDEDRVENIRRVAEVSKLMMDAGLIVITALISPFRQERASAREIIGAENFCEVYISTPIDVCEQRDPKGLYKKARSGQIPNFTGIGSPYEKPENADIEVDSTCISKRDAIKKILEASNIFMSD